MNSHGKNIEANSCVRQTEKERGSMTAFILSFHCIPHIRRKCALHIVQWKCRRHTNNEPRYGFKWLLFYWNATVNIANVNHFQSSYKVSRLCMPLQLQLHSKYSPSYCSKRNISMQRGIQREKLKWSNVLRAYLRENIH